MNKTSGNDAQPAAARCSDECGGGDTMAPLPRREFLALALLGSAVILAACGSGDTGSSNASGDPVAPIPYRYGTWRMHNAEVSWRTIQPTQGNYVGSGSDRAAMMLDWTQFDARLQEAYDAGISVAFSAWLTPAWASRPADQVGGSNTVFGPWTVVGESAVPQKSQYVYDFVLSVLQRANSSVRRLKYLETLNEPEFLSAQQLADYLAEGGRPFWTGTAVQAVAYAAAAWKAAQDFNDSVPADRRVTVLCPAQYDIDRLSAFLTAQDPVSGRFGHQTFDWMNIHPYTAVPNKALGGEDLYYAGGSRIGVAACTRALAALGLPPRPVAVTEWGLNTELTDAQVVAFAELPVAERRTYIARTLAMAALDGVALFTIFSGTQLAGDYDNDTAGVIAAVTDVHTKLAGQTIVAGGYRSDGSVTVTLASGSTLVW